METREGRDRGSSSTGRILGGFCFPGAVLHHTVGLILLTPRHRLRLEDLLPRDDPARR
ncbi:MAG: hypothetical protein RBS95_08815 [Desulfobulbus sp.]|jgi:hypothetical protein|nr:hypothetical protein [Desulfobulbus sp.]